jgi:hypothetical protein
MIKIHFKKIRNLFLIVVTLAVMPLNVKSKILSNLKEENLIQTQELLNTRYTCNANIFKN